MRAERRHELRANTLAQGIGALPLFWHKHGTKVMLVVVAALAVWLFVRFQIRSAARDREMASEAYATALSSIGSLGDPRLGPEQRRDIHTQANAAIDQVLEGTKDGAIRAEAMHARGELNWTLATLLEDMDPTGSSTQPSARPAQSTDDLLDKARQAYEAAIQTDGAKPMTVTTAHFGLANIAEQRRQWDAARAEYQKVLDDANAAAAFKEQANLRLADLKRLQDPPLLGKPATAPVAPEPSIEAGPPALATTRAATQPTTQPATKSSKP